MVEVTKTFLQCSYVCKVFNSDCNLDLVLRLKLIN